MTAFANCPEGGNPAGIVIDADGMTSKEMLQIAKEIGYSETAFVSKSDVADFKVRFFTPTNEVDLCGHATIATFNLLRDLGKIAAGIYTQETLAGILKVYVDCSSVLMEQATPMFYETIPLKELAPCFKNNLKEQILTKGDKVITLPIHIVSTGLKDIFLPIYDYESLLALRPDFKEICRLSEKYEVTGIHAFSLKTKNSDTFAATRNFAPRVGIDEESATGTSNGALVAYLINHGILPKNTEATISIEQGTSLNRPSHIIVKASSNEKGTIIQVGGESYRIH